MSKLYDQQHYHLRCGITIEMKKPGSVKLADGTVKTMEDVAYEQATKAAFDRMSTKEKVQLLKKLMEEA